MADINAFFNDIANFVADEIDLYPKWMVPESISTINPESINDYFTITGIDEDVTENSLVEASRNKNYILSMRRSFHIRHLDPIRAFIVSKNIIESYNGIIRE